MLKRYQLGAAAIQGEGERFRPGQSAFARAGLYHGPRAERLRAIARRFASRNPCLALLAAHLTKFHLYSGNLRKEPTVFLAGRRRESKVARPNLCESSNLMPAWNHLRLVTSHCLMALDRSGTTLLGMHESSVNQCLRTEFRFMDHSGQPGRSLLPRSGVPTLARTQRKPVELLD
jgi:hypothetical protein